mmetsp:Transcript_12307/g.31177  ORF Transcript_12307/g.31177 Transcript_12307/m.31177 type:complete len:308 (+) Transcript_12307:454-1377(+)
MHLGKDARVVGLHPRSRRLADVVLPRGHHHQLAALLERLERLQGARHRRNPVPEEVRVEKLVHDVVGHLGGAVPHLAEVVLVVVLQVVLLAEAVRVVGVEREEELRQHLVDVDGDFGPVAARAEGFGLRAGAAAQAALGLALHGLRLLGRGRLAEEVRRLQGRGRAPHGLPLPLALGGGDAPALSLIGAGEGGAAAGKAQAAAEALQHLARGGAHAELREAALVSHLSNPGQPLRVLFVCWEGVRGEKNVFPFCGSGRARVLAIKRGVLGTSSSDPAPPSKSQASGERASKSATADPQLSRADSLAD